MTCIFYPVLLPFEKFWCGFIIIICIIKKTSIMSTRKLLYASEGSFYDFNRSTQLGYSYLVTFLCTFSNALMLLLCLVRVPHYYVLYGYRTAVLYGYRTAMSYTGTLLHCLVRVPYCCLVRVPYCIVLYGYHTAMSCTGTALLSYTGTAQLCLVRVPNCCLVRVPYCCIVRVPYCCVVRVLYCYSCTGPMLLSCMGTMLLWCVMSSYYCFIQWHEFV